MKKFKLFISIMLMLSVLSMAGCDQILPTPSFEDITIEVGEEIELVTELDLKVTKVAVEYAYEGNNISIENGVLRALVAETETVVFARYLKSEVEFKVVVTRSSKPIEKPDDNNTELPGDDNNQTPGDDDNNHTPGDDDNNQTPGDDDNNQTPGDDDNNQTPGDDDNNQTPGDDDNNQTPGDDDNNHTPGDDDNNQTPGDDDNNQTPGDDDNNQTPDDGTGDTPIVDPETPKPEEPEVEDKGTMAIEGPSSIYSNYPGKEIKVTFSNPKYASEITYTTNNQRVKVENGKIYATGIFENATTVTVTATSEHHGTRTFQVVVSTYNVHSAETKVQYYENNIIKEENKGGIIFVGDSYFDGYTVDKPPFWSDFYQDFPNEKAFLMGISSSQINTLEIVSERIVYPMAPKEIVVHIGFNDVHHGNLTVDQLYERIIALCEKYKEALPDVKVYFIGVEPKKNGYSEGTDYYNSSTVKAPALTEKIKEYAQTSEWFTYVDTMSVFVDSNGKIKTGSYLSTDLSHPTLAAYDEIRAILNGVRGVENYVPSITDDPNAIYIEKLGNGNDINASGRYFTSADGNALTNNYVISGTLTVTDINAAGAAHLQFRFSQGFRFLLWDSDKDGKLGAGYMGTGLTTKNDTTAGAAIFDATSQLTLDWMIIVDNGKAYWYINNTLMATFDAPTRDYFNIGAVQMNAVVYDISLTVKAENEKAYTDIVSKYINENSPSNDPNALYINKLGNGSDINGSGKTYTDKNGNALTNNYVISGTLQITAINKSNAHLQFRFNNGSNGDYRFLLWDSDSDGKVGVGYIAGSTNKSDKTAGAVVYDANNTLTLNWAIVVNNGKAYFYINDVLMETMEAPVLSYFNIGALQMNAVIYNVELTVKSENESAYNSLLAKYSIT